MFEDLGLVYYGPVDGHKTDDLIKAFDAVKDAYVAPQKIEWLTNYCKIGPQIASALDVDCQRVQISNKLVADYIEPSYVLWKSGKNMESAKKYREMIVYLAKRYCCLWIAPLSRPGRPSILEWICW